MSGDQYAIKLHPQNQAHLSVFQYIIYNIYACNAVAKLVCHISIPATEIRLKTISKYSN